MKIIKNLFLIVMILFFKQLSFAQKLSSKEEIDAARYNFIEKRLEMTEVQSQKFWPIYNDYLDQKKVLKKAIRKLKVQEYTNAASDEELSADLKRYFELRQQDLQLEQSYFAKFAKIISVRQLAELIKAERAFIQLLYKKIENE